MKKLILIYIFFTSTLVLSHECANPVKKVDAYLNKKLIKKLDHRHPETISLMIHFKKCFKEKSISIMMKAQVKDAKIYDIEEKDEFSGVSIVVGYDLGPSKVNNKYTSKKSLKASLNDGKALIKKVPVAKLFEGKKTDSKKHFTEFIYEIKIKSQTIKTTIKGIEPVA